MSRQQVTLIVGPSGVGKHTVITHLLDFREDLTLQVSDTTRDPREGEVHKLHYFFIPDAEFDRREAAGDYLVKIRYPGNGHRYADAYPGPEVAHALFEVNVDGARQILAVYPDATVYFLMPGGDTPEEKRAFLRGRLDFRATETEGAKKARLDAAMQEIEQGPALATCVIVNYVSLRTARRIADELPTAE